MTSISTELRTAINVSAANLRDSSKTHKCNELHCPACCRKLPAEAKTCHLCDMRACRKLCTNQTRFFDYFSELRRPHLWPCHHVFERESLSNIVKIIHDIKAGNIEHKCDAGTQCELHIEFAVLRQKVDDIVKNAEGLSLHEVEE